MRLCNRFPNILKTKTYCLNNVVYKTLQYVFAWVLEEQDLIHHSLGSLFSRKSIFDDACYGITIYKIRHCRVIWSTEFPAVSKSPVGQVFHGKKLIFWNFPKLTKLQESGNTFSPSGCSLSLRSPALYCELTDREKL